MVGLRRVPLVTGGAGLWCRRMRCAPCLLVLLLSVPAAPWLAALDANANVNPSADEAEGDTKFFRDMMADAAAYRVGLVSATAAQQDNESARRYLREAKELLASGHEIRARWRAEDGFDEHPYSALAGDLLRTAMEGYAVGRKLSGVHESLLKLWLFIPNWQGMDEAMRRAIEVAEREQDFSAAINLEADDPAKVIAIDGTTLMADSGTNRLFRFLAQHGDRAGVAPRAALGLARSQLIHGGRDQIFEARAAYERFIGEYPANPQYTFPAVCEYALSYLVTYRGANYDMGVLVMAATLIDQAEIETMGAPDRVATVQAYRKRIRLWMQDRDLAVARWYRDRGTPPVLAWLRMPAGLRSWSDGAHTFYDSVVARDPASNQARDAERERSALPPKSSTVR